MLAWIAALAGGAAIALALVARNVPWFAADLTIVNALQQFHFGVLAAPLDALNRLGFPPLVGVVYGGAILAMLVAGRRWEAAVWSFGVLGAFAINNGTKLLVPRARPPLTLVHVEHHIVGSSFPAGHVLNFTVFAGFLAYLAWTRLPASGWRTTLVFLLAATILLMGVARIVAGEHWPSDVLGGYLMGAAWLSLTIMLYRWGHVRFALTVAPPAYRVAVVTPLTPGAHSAAATRPAGRRSRRSLRLLGVLLPFMYGMSTRIAFADTAAPDDSLQATWQVPWNPAHALPRRTAWEQVVLLPGRLLSLPLVGIGYLTNQGLGALEQSRRSPLGPAASSPRPIPPVSPHLAQLGDRTGLGLAVVAQTPLPMQTRFAVEFAASVKRYNRTLLSLSGKPLALQYGYEWRPQDRFYGVGSSSSLDSVSDYAMQREFVRLSSHRTWGRDSSSARPRFVLDSWAGPRSVVTSNGREVPQFSYDERFPGLSAATLDRRTEHFVSGVSASVDERSGTPHWSRGWRMFGSAERFASPLRALALHSASDDGATFARFQLEAEAGVSRMRDPRTLRFLVHVTDQRVSAHRDHFLLSDLATLGGQPGLTGYFPGRFHDLDMLLMRVTYVFPLVRRLEMDVHAESGAVYPDLWRDASLGSLQHSVGFALRARMTGVPHGALGFDFSRESVRLHYTLGAVE